MKSEKTTLHPLPVRGVLGPVFIALALAAGVLRFRIDSPELGGLSLVFLVLALAFSRDSRRLLSGED